MRAAAWTSMQPCAESTMRGAGVFFAAMLRRKRPQRAELLALGLRFAKSDWSEDAGWRIVANRIPRVVRELVEGGWQVSAEGRAFRQPGQFSVSVSSGVDWFELHGAAALWRNDSARCRSCWPRCDAAKTWCAGRWLLRPAAGGVAAPVRACGRAGEARGRSHPLSPQPGGCAGCAAGDPAGSGLR